jgi:hypothetical protein
VLALSLAFRLSDLTVLVLYSLVCEWLLFPMGHCVFLSLLQCLFLGLQKVSGYFTLFCVLSLTIIPLDLSESEWQMCLAALNLVDKTCYSLGSK